MGNIKIIPEGMDTCDIKEKDRDNAIRNFFVMKNRAEEAKDTFYASDSFYSYVFSYGNFFSDFVFQTWEDVQKKSSLKGITQTTMQFVLNSLQCFPKEISDVDFNQLEAPRTKAGFKQSKSISDYISDEYSWKNWRASWYRNNQDKIDWSNASNSLFPFPAIIESILKRELLSHKISPNHDFVNLFHEKVMKHKGTELIAYAEKIGKEICMSNYYIYEHDLSISEQRKSSSIRRIFSIINKEKKKQYISIDFAHGMFEFLNENGKHQGEYRFDGSYNAEPENDHSFKTL